MRTAEPRHPRQRITRGDPGGVGGFLDGGPQPGHRGRRSAARQRNPPPAGNPIDRDKQRKIAGAKAFAELLHEAFQRYRLAALIGLRAPDHHRQVVALQRVAQRGRHRVGVDVATGQQLPHLQDAHIVAVGQPPVPFVLIARHHLLGDLVDVFERDPLHQVVDGEPQCRVQLGGTDLVDDDAQRRPVAQPVRPRQRIDRHLALRQAAGVFQRGRRRLEVLDRDAMADRGEERLDAGGRGVGQQLQQLRITAQLGDLGDHQLLDVGGDVGELVVEPTDDRGRGLGNHRLVRSPGVRHEQTVVPDRGFVSGRHDPRPSGPGERARKRDFTRRVDRGHARSRL
ncbi:hypothetical protein C1Y40_00413 [Mycobacterium talmoniae]|uniref:Uncharacterized protein n=1 Tax=Mycobacterium talmoniae TaxID=1858794 RepID=A0A2S8BRV6_9MYCO|nr:hypothetical protein C1Y40_00413 [Mycobacterium talmoniae]